MDDPRSNIQRVAYELSDNKLIRHYWNVLDRSQDTESISRELLEGVNAISFRFLKPEGGWESEWPPSDSSTNSSTTSAVDPRAKANLLPKGVEVNVELDNFGKVKRIYELVSNLDGIAIQPSTNNTGGNSQNNSGATNATQ